MTKLTINLDDEVLGEMVKFLSAIRMTGARPESVLEAIGARIVIAIKNKEEEITIRPLTIAMITGTL